MRCELKLNQAASRLQTRYYVGTPAGTIGSNLNYAWVLSDKVQSGRYWEVFRASSKILAGTGVESTGLWLIPPGSSLPGANGAPYTRNAFFAGDTAQNANGPPVGRAIRVDEMDANLTSEIFTATSEISFIRARRLLVPSGCILMAYNGADAGSTGGAAFAQLSLEIQFIEFQETEVVGFEL